MQFTTLSLYNLLSDPLGSGIAPVGLSSGPVGQTCPVTVWYDSLLGEQPGCSPHAWCCPRGLRGSSEVGGARVRGEGVGRTEGEEPRAVEQGWWDPYAC